jgi:hypothetical protein
MVHGNDNAISGRTITSAITRIIGRQSVPHVAQHHAAGRAHHHVAELEHAQAGQRLVRRRRLTPAAAAS